MRRPTNEQFAAIPRLWGLLDAVIEDAGAIDREKYHPRGVVFHRPRPPRAPNPGDCAVCAAGIVMAVRLDAPFNERCDPGCWPDETAKRLDAIDYLRRGFVHEAGHCLYGYADDAVRLVDGRLGRATLPRPRDVRFDGWRAFGGWLGYARELRDVLKGVDL